MCRYYSPICISNSPSPTHFGELIQIIIIPLLRHVTVPQTSISPLIRHRLSFSISVIRQNAPSVSVPSLFSLYPGLSPDLATAPVSATPSYHCFHCRLPHSWVSGRLSHRSFSWLVILGCRLFRMIDIILPSEFQGTQRISSSP